MQRKDLVQWYEQHLVGKNALLVVAGDVDPKLVVKTAQASFGAWPSGTRATPRYAPPPKRSHRTFVLVDRPGSVQSVILIGNLAISRANPQWLPLEAANQVLGGSAASRLFMDLREKRGLTYGAYSAVGELVQPGPFTAYVSVRTPVTTEAVGALFEHLGAIHSKAPKPVELANATRFLSDSFPLRIDTIGNLARLIVELRVFDLPGDYWNHYRQRIRKTSVSEALQAARSCIRPEEALVVIVGQAARYAQSLRRWAQ